MKSARFFHEENADKKFMNLTDSSLKKLEFDLRAFVYMINLAILFNLSLLCNAILLIESIWMKL